MTMPASTVQHDAASDVQLAEVVGALALATDLGLGQPLDHVVRSCIIATRFAEHLGLPREERDATYWVTLLVTAGCTGVSFEMAHVFGDDISFRAGMYTVGASTAARARYLLAAAGSTAGLFGRARILGSLVWTRLSVLEQSFLAHCAVSARLAERLTLGDTVVAALWQTFARWDGTGLPRGLAGAEILRPIRLATIANVVEVRHRLEGVAATLTTVRAGSGTEFDPALVEAWCAGAAEALADLDTTATWERFLALQPRGRGPLSEPELDDALTLLADYADLKSPWFIGHSRGVAALAVAAAEQAGLPATERIRLRRATLVHDLGRNGVPNSIWDKPGPLSPSERERVRLHAYYTDRVLHRAGRLVVLASIASAAHERGTGTGYPRGSAGNAIPLLGRYLGAADTYHAMREDRPHRRALSRALAERELRRMARAGELDGGAVDAVLAAEGQPPRRKPSAPAGLTAREVEVLVLAARGGTARAVAEHLGIAPKTAANHLERIYSKIGVSSRAEAALFAMQQGLVPGWDSASFG